jgi:membrane protease YdiL (CAAX protease family)
MALLGAMVFSAVVVAPIAEEVIFRGFLYPVVKRYSEPWFAAIFTGCLFGVIHFNLMSFPLLALMGIVLVVLYEITGSLWVPIACHAAFNALQVGVMMLARLYEIPLAP